MNRRIRGDILVVDDDPGVVDLIHDILRADGHQVTAFTSPHALLQHPGLATADLVITDVEMPELRGTQLLQRLLDARPTLLVMLITAFGTIDLAVECLRAGAADFLSKPFSPDTLRHVVQRNLRERAMRTEIVRLRMEAERRDTIDGLLAESPAMRQILERAGRIARTRSPVLITGESGTGKSELARWIHARSDRSRGPFLSVNSSTLLESLAEGELFGVRRGAYTDAHEDRPGLFAEAQGGTLFLDEIGDLPRGVQAKLLHVLETQRFRRVGDTHDTPSDVRIIAATHVDLRAAIAAGAFRQDLFFRLDVFRLDLPALRERAEDIPGLVDVWLQRLGERHGRPIVGVAASAWRWLRAHPWPGNIRELVHRLERAVVLADHEVLTVDDLADPTTPPDPRVEAGPPSELRRLVEAGLTLREVEGLYARAMLEACAGNKADAARRLGVDRKTLSRKVEDPVDAEA